MPRWAAVLARNASDLIKEPARSQASPLSPYVGRYNAESMASMASVLLMVHLIRRYFLGRSLLLVKEHGAYHLKASLGSLLGLAFLVFIVFALAAAAAEVDDEEPCSALRYARRKGGCVDVRLVDWRWRQADVSDEEEAVSYTHLTLPTILLV